MKKIVIDLVPIRVGEGGTGSGIWTYARELLSAMDEQDTHDLEIVCLINEGQVPYLQLKNIRTVVFSLSGKNILKRLWWVHVHLPFWCLTNRVDVLHKVATETPWLCSVARVTTIHDFYYEFLIENHPPESVRLYERLENAYFSFVTRLCFNKSARLIAVSAATRAEAVRRYPDCADRISTIHHGPPSVRHEALGVRHDGQAVSESTRTADIPNAPRPLPSSSLPFTILCVAKFMDHKGQHLLIQGFEQLLSCHPELKGQLVLNLRGFHNDAAYFDSIRTMIRQSSCREWIHVIPFEAKDTAEQIYAGMDLVVLLSAYEGFGLPVLEAQSFGIPVMCSDQDVLQEVGGEGAVYVDRENIGRIADGIKQFFDDQKFCSQMAEKALDNVKRFSWQKAAELTLQVYASAIGESEEKNG